MISKILKTSNGPLKITIPSDAKEISIDLLQRLTPEPGYSFSELEMISILSGIPVEPKDFTDLDTTCLADIYNIDDLRVFDETLAALAYQIKHFELQQEIPKFVSLQMPQTNIKRWFNRNNGNTLKVIPVLNNLGISPAGAYLEAREVIKKEFDIWERIKEEYGAEIEFNPSIAAQIRLLSLYFYCPATGDKFNSRKAKEFDEVIKELPITQALPIARYFFLRYPNLSKEKISPSLQRLKEMKLKRV